MIAASANGLTLVPKELEAEPCTVLTGLRAQRMFGAYLVRDADLDNLRTAEEHFVDRKTKNERKELARVLLEQKRIPLVSGGYSTSGRLIQGVQALLRKATAIGDLNLYVIGTGDELFDELWQQATTSAGPGPRVAGNNARGAGARTVPSQEAMAANRLLQLLPTDPVPTELTKVYIGESAEARLVRKLIMVAATRTEEPVLILGDTGSGKEVVARAIHNYSPRREHQFVAVNCAAIPRELLEVELFGAAGGVATGVTARAGLWELTGKGTLFLDEIGDLSPEHQVKILRALQERRIKRVGESREREVGARIITATNRNLFSMVQAGRFRDDLYYRLHYFRIPTPALDAHPADIALLAAHLWNRITADPVHQLPREMLDRLVSYPWPGNVRELKAVLSNIYALFGKDNLSVAHLDALYQPSKVPVDVELLQKADEERLRRVASNFETHDTKQESRLIGVWSGTGKDLEVPKYLELDQTHTYKLQLELRRRDEHISGTMRVTVHERKRTDEARVELISITGDYFTFQYLLTRPHASHYGVMMLNLSAVGDEMKGVFLTRKIFENKMGIGMMNFKKR
jgi:DNA-binding NtrC family response regulator